MRSGNILVATSFLVLSALTAHAAGGESYQGLCSILAGNRIKAQDCTVTVSANAFSATYVLDWQDGDTTVIKLSDDGNSVNGEQAVEVATPVDIATGSECYETLKTKDVYCIKTD